MMKIKTISFDKLYANSTVRPMFNIIANMGILPCIKRGRSGTSNYWFTSMQLVKKYELIWKQEL